MKIRRNARLATLISASVAVFGLFAATPALATHGGACLHQSGDGSVQCSGTNVYTGTTCRALPEPVCTAPRSQVDCGSWSCVCPSGQLYCGAYNTCVTPGSCTGGQTYDICANNGAGGCVGNINVILNPATAQSGNISITGNATTSGDVYMANGKAIRVDANGAAALYMSNWHATGNAFDLVVGDPTLGAGLKLDGMGNSLTLNRSATSFMNRMIWSTGGTNDWQVGQLWTGSNIFAIKRITSPPDVGVTPIYIDGTGDGLIGLGNIQNPSSVLDILGSFTVRGQSAPPSAPAGQGRLYFDAGTSKFRISENGGAYVNMVNTNGATVTGTPAAGQAAFWTGASTLSGDGGFLWDNTNKRLGIGTSLVQGTFHIVSTATYPMLLQSTGTATGIWATTSTAGTNDLHNGLYLERDTTATAAAGLGTGVGFSLEDASGSVYAGTGGIYNQWTDAAAATRVSALTFYTKNSAVGMSEKMRIAGNGNVGIGTTAPGQLLDVQGAASPSLHVKNTATTGYSQLLMSNSVNANAGQIFLNGSANSGYAGTNSFNVYSGVGSIGFHTASATNAMTILQSGNVGIGATNPGAPLEIKYNTTGYLQFGLSNRGMLGGNSGGNLHIDSTPGNLYLNYYSGTGIYFGNGAGSATGIWQTNGNVGVGTTSPAEKLSVAGNISVTGTVDGADIDVWKTEYDSRFGIRTGASFQNNTTLLHGILQNNGDGLLNESGAAWKSGWWHVLNMRHDHQNGYNSQIATSFGGGEIYYRGSSGGTWSKWKQFITDDGNGNIGLGATPVSYNAVKLLRTMNNASYDDVGIDVDVDQTVSDSSRYLKAGRFYAHVDGNAVDLQTIYGVEGIASSSFGSIWNYAHGGHFEATASASGWAAGVYATATTQANDAYGVLSMMGASSSYNKIGMFTHAYGGGTGTNYGVYTWADGVGGTNYALYVRAGRAYKADGGSWEVASDARLKRNIHPFTDGLETARQLNPASYEYNGKAETTAGVKGIGFIAQEIKDLVPYMIAKAPIPLNPGETPTDIYTLDASSLSYINLNAIKELDRMTLKVDENGNIRVEGDLSAEDNVWGTGSGWISCPEQGECVCPEGSYMTKIMDRGAKAYCNTL